MNFQGKKFLKTGIVLFSSGLLVIIIVAAVIIIRTRGRTQLQVDILLNKEIIYLSTFAEPPQFAIWLENPETGENKTVFVTHRVSVGDWEGKSDVPVALPQWYRLFRGNARIADKSDLAVTGATPKDDYFTVRVEVKPGSEWICWIEMNLAGDYNEAFPETDVETFYEDEFSCGQPALLYKAEIKAIEDLSFTPELEAQSVWSDGSIYIEPVSDGITTAKQVFETIQVSVIRPKPKLFEKYKVNV